MENFKIIFERENPVFSRKEIIIEIKKEIMPKITEVEVLLGEKFSTPVDAIKINKILSRFGSDIFTIYAKIYKSKEDKEEIEPKIKTKSAKPIENAK